MRGENMEVYRVEKKRSRFFETFFTVVVTIIVTLAVERMVVREEMADPLASKLSYEEEKGILREQEVSGEENNLSFDSLLESTVGISIVTPSGANILDVDIEEKWGLGTGVIVSSKGYVLTNQHLAKKVGSKVVVTLNSGKTIPGEIMWVEENLDLAIIKIEEKDLKPVILGDDRMLALGETVYAIGNPLGAEFRGSVTKGIVSGKNRTILFSEKGKEVFMEGLIQTDASINPGNSGGPLVNSTGEVVGINTVKITSAEGIGFSVPISVVKSVIQSFEEEGSFEEPTLGIYAYDSNVLPYLQGAKSFTNGIYVSSVEENGPCAQKGIQKGDVITQIDGTTIHQMMELRAYLYAKKPGEHVRLTVQNGVTQEIEVTLQKK